MLFSSNDDPFFCSTINKSRIQFNYKTKQSTMILPIDSLKNEFVQIYFIQMIFLIEQRNWLSIDQIQTNVNVKMLIFIQFFNEWLNRELWKSVVTIQIYTILLHKLLTHLYKTYERTIVNLSHKFSMDEIFILNLNRRTNFSSYVCITKSTKSNFNISVVLLISSTQPFVRWWTIFSKPFFLLTNIDIHRLSQRFNGHLVINFNDWSFTFRRIIDRLKKNSRKVPREKWFHMCLSTWFLFFVFDDFDRKRWDKFSREIDDGARRDERWKIEMILEDRWREKRQNVAVVWKRNRWVIESTSENVVRTSWKIRREIDWIRTPFIEIFLSLFKDYWTK